MRTVITNPRLLGLLLSSLSTLFVGMSLFPIFPHYAAELGAGPGVVGASLAVIYVASTLGPTVTGLLARRVPRKLLFIAAGMIGPPSIALLGAVTALWQAVALMAIAWFCGSVILTLVNVFTGIYADGAVRGRAYALMSLSAPLGALLGGVATTALLSRFDFAAACLGLAGVWAMLPLVGLLTLDGRAEQRQAASQAPAAAPAGPGVAFAMVLAASLLGHIAIAVGRLGTSLLMQAQELPAADVAATAAISGVASIPLILLFGALADRLGRRPAFALTGVLAALGVALQIGAAAPWQFWLAATLLLAAFCASNALGAALAADIVGQAALGGAMARYGAAGSAAAVVSFAVAGYAFALLGPAPLFALAALLGLVAAAFALRGGRPLAERPAAPAVAPGGD
jgi:MFS family permease